MNKIVTSETLKSILVDLVPDITEEINKTTDQKLAEAGLASDAAVKELSSKVTALDGKITTTQESVTDLDTELKQLINNNTGKITVNEQAIQTINGEVDSLQQSVSDLNSYKTTDVDPLVTALKGKRVLKLIECSSAENTPINQTWQKTEGSGPVSIQGTLVASNAERDALYFIPLQVSEIGVNKKYKVFIALNNE